MLHSLYIKNYVLIDELDLQFSSGFTTITGETGAGKSILMGALSLILGQRADTSVLKTRDKKCIVEGTFKPGKELVSLFDLNEVDFEEITTIRREIAPGGKSRAFINDTPVNLSQLKEIGNRLVDIHSQHQNLQLNDHLYQLEVIDHMAATGGILSEYQLTFEAYGVARKELENLKSEVSRKKEELAYMQFQYNELHSAHLKQGEMTDLEADLQRAEHAEEIKSALFHSSGLLSDETQGILDQLREALAKINHVSNYFSPAKEMAKRLESAYIDLKDLTSELVYQAERTDIEPGKLADLRERMDLLLGLMQKHRVGGMEELEALRDNYGRQIEDLTFSDEKINKLEEKSSALFAAVRKQAEELHLNRVEAAKEMEVAIEPQLKLLGILNARFEVSVEWVENYTTHGADEVKFLFSAIKQGNLEE